MPGRTDARGYATPQGVGGFVGSVSLCVKPGFHLEDIMAGLIIPEIGILHKCGHVLEVQDTTAVQNPDGTVTWSFTVAGDNEFAVCVHCQKKERARAVWVMKDKTDKKK